MSSPKTSPRYKQPARTRRRGAGNLPIPLTTLIERGEQTGQVAKLLSSARLVTLTGMAGVGKSRLAIKVAGEATGKHPQGTWWVELAAIRDPSAVAGAVASVLGIRDEPRQPLMADLLARLRDEQVLIVLDNCEQVIEAAADVAANLLKNCEGLSMLATSREPLGISGEAVWQVPPLSVPESHHPRRGFRSKPLDSYGAVQLFVERARDIEPGFSLRPHIAADVAEICRRLDGIPLAIELAVARVGSLTPAQIASRLDDRFKLLTAGDRTALPHHQTLLAAMQWSYDLLTGPEQALLRRLSIFAGGCTLEAVEEVCTQDPVTREEVLDLLSALVAKSLVVFEKTGLHGRYRLLETIREYAYEKLQEQGEGPRVGERFAGWFLKLAEEAEPELTGSEQDHWLDALEIEYDNLRAALGWAFENHPASAVRLAGALIMFWQARSHLREGRGWLERAVSASEQSGDLPRAKVLWGAAVLGAVLNAAAQRSALEESISLARQFGDRQLEARALNILGYSFMQQKSLTGVPCFKESIDLARKCGDVWCLAHSLSGSGRAYMFHGDPAAARPYFKESLQVGRLTRDRRAVSDSLYGMGWVDLAQGDLKQAQDVLKQALGAARESGDKYQVSLVLGLLGEVLRLKGDFGQARDFFGEGLDVGGGKVPFPRCRCLLGLGKVALAEGDLQTATEYFEQAEALARNVPLPHMMASILLGSGQIHEVARDLKGAREAYEEALQFAKEHEEKASVARCLYQLGRLARQAEDYEKCGPLFYEALGLFSQIGDRLGLAAALDALGGMMAQQQRQAQAVRLFGKAQSVREGCGLAEGRSPDMPAEYHKDIAVARRALNYEEFARAWKEGAAMTDKEAISYGTKGRERRGRPVSGWASLTQAERGVSELVRQGFTNPEVAERLFVSPRTVQAHLSRVFAKLGIATRRELRELEKLDPDSA